MKIITIKEKYTMTSFAMKTKDGLDYYETISALQKDIRRGKEKEALFWALQLAEGNCMPHLLNRLPIIAIEDVGVCDGGLTIILVQTLVTQIKTYFDKKNDAWFMMLSNCILAMCRAQKTREAENFLTVVKVERKNGWKPEIPDYALDMHTRRGKAKGRGIQFFVENEQQVSTLFNPGRNDYVDIANKYELEGACEGLSNDDEEELEDMQTKLF
jgi:replication-associated recombination protein RarA